MLRRWLVMSRCFENSSPQSCGAVVAQLWTGSSPSTGKKARTRSLVVDTFWAGGTCRAGRGRGRAAFVLPWPEAPGLASPPREGRQLLEKRLA